MNDTDHARQLFDYNYWAHRRVWGCIEQLNNDEFMQPTNYSVGSIHRQVFHTMAVEYWWFVFLKEDRLEFLEESDYADRASIREKWDRVEAYARMYLAELTDQELQRMVKPAFWEDELPAITVAQALAQVLNHGTDHRAQTLAQLHRLGAPTVAQDYLEYLHVKEGK